MMQVFYFALVKITVIHIYGFHKLISVGPVNCETFSDLKRINCRTFHLDAPTIPEGI